MDIFDIFNTSALGAVEAKAPVGFEFGTVKSSAPLSIFVSDKKTLGEEFLILTNAVKDYYVDVELSTEAEEAGGHTHSVNGETETEKEHTHGIELKTGTAGGHTHGISGICKMRIYNGLKEGERVLLCRVQGGQKYIVIDRISEAVCEGKWL